MCVSKPAMATPFACCGASQSPALPRRAQRSDGPRTYREIARRLQEHVLGRRSAVAAGGGLTFSRRGLPCYIPSPSRRTGDAVLRFGDARDFGRGRAVGRLERLRLAGGIDLVASPQL